MMISSKRALFSLALLLGLLFVAGAEERGSEESGEEPSDGSADGENKPLVASEYAQTVVLFPDFPDKKIVLGELVEALCGFSNVGDKSFNITQMKGSLHSAINYQYIQNFTEIMPFSEIKKGEQGTMSYRFFPDPKLDPAEYVLTLSIDYIDADKEEYRTVYFNSTIEIVESQSSIDSRTFFGRLLFLCIFALGGFFSFQFYKKQSAKKGRRSADPASKQSSHSEWLQDVTQLPAGGKRGSGKTSKKAN